jgi:hypothetical protein
MMAASLSFERPPPPKATRPVGTVRFTGALGSYSPWRSSTSGIGPETLMTIVLRWRTQ